MHWLSERAEAKDKEAENMKNMEKIEKIRKEMERDNRLHAVKIGIMTVEEFLTWYKENV